jgi:hypothetical protein
MKVLFFAVLEKGAASDSLLKALSVKGYNGTLIQTESLKHVLKSHDGAAFISLSELADNTPDMNNSMFFIIDETKVPEIKQEFRDFTADFTKAHGAMFIIPIEDFEGSF